MGCEILIVILCDEALILHMSDTQFCPLLLSNNNLSFSVSAQIGKSKYSLAQTMRAITGVSLLLALVFSQSKGCTLGRPYYDDYRPVHGSRQR